MLIQNILLFCFIFWGLTWLGEFFFKTKTHKNSKKFIECGFKASINKFVQINFNFLIFLIFLILYDVEFLFLIPYFFNIANASLFSICVYILFIFFIVFSLSVDLQLNSLTWKL